MVASTKMNVIVVGGGLGGLTTALAMAKDGHKVNVYDAAPAFGEAGAGIRVPPNSSRLLMRLGVDFNKIKKSTSSRYHFLSWQTGKTITQFQLGNAVETYGAPYYLVHRADLHGGILEAAIEAGVGIHVASSVVSYDFENCEIEIQGGAKIKGDLLVCADGIKSIAREGITGHKDVPIDTGDVAYRILIPAEHLLADADLADLIHNPCTTSWCGPDAHIVGYPIRDDEVYNIVVCATNFDEFKDEGWVIKGDPTELCDRFKDWDVKVRKLCALTTFFQKWRLFDLKPVENWIHPSYKAVLLGDSCHPMLPYLAQGAAQAVEDAITLTTVVRNLDEKKTLKAALEEYEKLRKPRASLVQSKTREHQYILHIPDGEEQVKRDNEMQIDAESNPVFWGQTTRRDWLFGHDAELTASRALAAH